jgi:hypothetical protein
MEYIIFYYSLESFVANNAHYIEKIKDEKYFDDEALKILYDEIH